MVDDAGRRIPGAALIRSQRAGEGQTLAITDETGTLRLEDPRESGDRLNVEAAGHLATPLARTVVADGVGRLVLVRAARVEGVVLDPAHGSPIPGVHVSIRAKGESLPAGTTVTDATGRFLLEGVAPGALVLETSAAGRMPTRREVVASPGARLTLAMPSCVGVRAGLVLRTRVTGVNIAAFHASLGNGAAFPEGLEILASTQASGTSATSGARHLLPLEIRAAKAETVIPLGTLPAGVPLELRVQADGFAPTSLPVRLLSDGEQISVSLTRGGSLSGQFLDEAGEPVPGVGVRLRASEAGLDDLLAWSGAGGGRSDQSGAFRVDRLPEATLRIELVDGNWILPAIPSYRAVDSESTSAGAITLLAGGALRGRVVSKGARASVASARVRACAERLGCRWSSPSRTDADGRFRLEGLAEGPFTIEVTSGNRPPVTIEGVTGGGAPVIIEIPQGATVRGRALDASGRPLARVRVGFFRPSFPGKAVLSRVATTTEGSFEIAGVPDGRWELVVRAPGLAPARVGEREVAESSVTDLGDVSLGTGRSVRGRVVGPEGEPVPGASIEVVSDSAASEEDALVAAGPDGRFDIGGLPDDSFRLLVDAPALAPARVSFPAWTAGDERELPERLIALGRGGAIEGSVTDADERPVHGAHVLIPELAAHFEAVTGIDGKYRLERVPAGPAMVRMTVDPAAPEIWTETRSVRVEEDGTQRVDFRGDGAIEGTVRRSGLPVAWADVRAVTSGGVPSLRSTQTDRDGEFRLAGIAPGTWTIHVRTQGCHATFPFAQPEERRRARLDLDLPSSELAGSVVDAAAGDPLPGSQVGWIAGDSSPDVVRYSVPVSDSRGGFVLVEDRPVIGAWGDAGPDGSFRVCVPPAGNVVFEARAGAEYEDASVDVSLPRPDPLLVRIAKKNESVRVRAVGPDGAAASQGGFVALVQEGGFYNVAPLGPGGEARFDPPPGGFRVWAGVHGVGLASSPWFAATSRPRGPIEVRVERGGDIRVHGLQALRATASERRQELLIRMMNPSGDDVFSWAETLDVLMPRRAAGSDEELLGPIPPARYVLEIVIGEETARTAEVVVGREPAFVDVAPR